jgi:hypothetical protein
LPRGDAKRDDEPNEIDEKLMLGASGVLLITDDQSKWRFVGSFDL